MPPTQRPNLLLITLDQLRFDTLGYAGHPVVDTPHIDALARRGMVFDRAYVTAPVCIPARRTLLSGLHPDTHGLRYYEDGLEWTPPQTLPGLLSDAGYQTQLVGKMHLHPQGKRYGFDHVILSETTRERPDSGFHERNDYIPWLRRMGEHGSATRHGANHWQGRPDVLEESLSHSSWLAEEAIDFLVNRRDPSCPFFMHLSFVHPHPPLTPPAPFWEKYAARTMDPPLRGDWVEGEPWQPGTVPRSDTRGPFKPEAVADARRGYYGLVEHVDACIAHVLDTYFEYGSARQQEPLYILLTSDHGEMLGDHELFSKTVPYESSAHIPYFISGYNVPLAAGRSDAFVTLEDVLPTFLDLAGVERPTGLDGNSLAAVVAGEPAPERDCIDGVCGPHHWLRWDDWKYLCWPANGEEQLFHLGEDPGELEDRSGDPEAGKALQVARERMAPLLKQRLGQDAIPDFKPLAGRSPSVFRLLGGGANRK
ncbi:MAG: sulfatase-like hydrolase/transferase [Opitutales bacterium]